MEYPMFVQSRVERISYRDQMYERHHAVHPIWLEQSESGEYREVVDESHREQLEEIYQEDRVI